jgi:hypothetical protein
MMEALLQAVEYENSARRRQNKYTPSMWVPIEIKRGFLYYLLACLATSLDLRSGCSRLFRILRPRLGRRAEHVHSKYRGIL